MNILDENIPEGQRELLRRWRVRVSQIGQGVGRQGIQDDEIIPLLHQLRRPTFFTRDADFYDRRLRHPHYCLVYLDLQPHEAAHFIRRTLRHPSLDTQAKRLGSVARVGHAGLRLWRRADVEEVMSWPR